MLNFNKLFLIIAGLIFFNTELIQAGGSLSRGFPSKKQQEEDDETERQRQAELAAQRAKSDARRAEINRKKDLETLDRYNRKQAAIKALKALPEMQEKYLEKFPAPKNDVERRALIKKGFTFAWQQYYTQLTVKTFFAEKKYTGPGSDQTLTQKEIEVVERCGRVAGELFLRGKKQNDTSIKEIQAIYAQILKADKDALQGKR
jgi:hypothetical protein